MKRKFVPILVGVSALALFAGCSIDLRFGGGSKSSTGGSMTSNSNSTANNNQHPNVVQQTPPTVGQQLLDLKKARDDGAISEQEYQTEKAKLLNQK